VTQCSLYANFKVSYSFYIVIYVYVFVYLYVGTMLSDPM